MWCRAVGDQAAARHPKVTGGKAAVSGLKSGHFRHQFHRSSDSSCKSCATFSHQIDSASIAEENITCMDYMRHGMHEIQNNK